MYIDFTTDYLERLSDFTYFCFLTPFERDTHQFIPSQQIEFNKLKKQLSSNCCLPLANVLAWSRLYSAHCVKWGQANLP